MKTLRLGTSTYSYWHFEEPKLPIEVVIDKAHELGFVGIELLHMQMESEDNDYLQRLKQYAFQRGVAIYNLAIHQSFVSDDAAERQRNIDHTLHGIDLAHNMSIPSIRVNAGTWRREGSGGLLESGGWAEPWAGFTQDDGFKWATDSLAICVEHAARQGVMLLLENHWGLTTTAANMVRIIETVNSPWLRAILDMGNFYFEEDMVAAVQTIAPYVDLAHAKTYPGGGLIYTLDLDYARIFEILLDAGFSGYVSLEMEGHEDPETAVPQSIAMLKEAWQTAQD
jgi:sugar phosphate isomerase/epimerase